MYFIGGDHYNNGIPHNDLQIYCHRLMQVIPWNLSDLDLRHQIYKVAFTGLPYYTRGDLTLETFLNSCKDNNIIPIVNSDWSYQDPDIPIAEYTRRVKIVDNLIYEMGFELAYHSIMNEPGKRHSTERYIQYVNASKQEAKHYKVIAGNDEYNMLNWNYLLDNADFDILGVHPLSGLGYPPNWQILNDWATMATARGKPYMITEGGSWFKSYFSAEGWEVIRDTILKAKNLGYLATCIVLLDVNEGNYPKLGFRRFDKDYKEILKDSNNNPIISEYWDNFIDLVNSEGNKYILIKEEDMILDSLYYEGRPEEKYVRDPAGRGIMFLRKCFELPDGNIFDNALNLKVREYQSINGMLIDGKVGPVTFSGLILEADYQKYYNYIHHDWATYS